MNKVVLSGRLTRDPELKRTGSGNSMVTFCMAVRNTAEKTYFLDCWAYDKLADLICINVMKGEKITVMGKVTQRTYEGSDGKNHNVVEVFVEEAEFQLKLQGTEVEETKKPKGKKSKKSKKPEVDLPDGDLPF